MQNNAENLRVVQQESVLKNRNFVLLFSGKVISQLGDQVYAFALSWYILDITKSGLQMASFLVIDNIAVAIISMFGGVIADRFNRKSIMVWMDMIRGLVVIAIALLFYHQMLQIWMLYVSAIFLGGCGAVFGPASQAIVPNIVKEDQLAEATSLNQFVFFVCAATGVIISGALFNIVGVFVLFLLNSLSYFISGALEMNVVYPFDKAINKIKQLSIHKEVHKIFQSLNEGIDYVMKNKLILNLMLANALTAFIFMPIISVYIPYLYNVTLKATPFQFALAVSGGQIGLIFGSVIIPKFIKKVKPTAILFWSLLSYSLFELIVAFVLFPSILSFINNWYMTYFFLIGGIFVGIGLTSYLITISVLMQQFCSDEYRGRFWGLSSTIYSFIVPFGFLIGGILVKYVCMSFIFLGASLLIFMINMWLVNLKEVKELV